MHLTKTVLLLVVFNPSFRYHVRYMYFILQGVLSAFLSF
jgi:hypothetical protein